MNSESRRGYNPFRSQSPSRQESQDRGERSAFPRRDDSPRQDRPAFPRRDDGPGGFRNDGPRQDRPAFPRRDDGPGGFRNDGPRQDRPAFPRRDDGPGGFRNDGPRQDRPAFPRRDDGPRNDGPRDRPAFRRDDGPRNDGPRFRDARPPQDDYEDPRFRREEPREERPAAPVRTSVQDSTLLYSSQLLGRWDELPQFDLHSTELRRSLPPDDAAVEQTRHLCRLVFRRRGGIDRAIGQLCPRQPAPRILRILRPALAWILFQDGLHPALAVDCAVRLANQTLDTRQAGFLNAVLRRAVEERDQLRALAMKDLDLGSWLESRWTARFGAAKTREMADILRLPAPVTARALANSPNSAATGLEAMPDMDWAEGERLYRVVEAQTFLRSEAARNFYFQDAATLLSIHLLDPQRGETIADLCAAPGGKAIVISERVGAKGHVIACDHSRERLFTLKDNLDGYSNVEIRQGDASKPQFDEASLDAVLLDVPCSNTGVLRRKPDAKWNQGPGKLDELVALQGKILDGACVVVRRGGRLVYSTCSIEPEENTQQVQAFLQRNTDFELVEERQLLPCEDHDGAYAAVLRRK